MKLAKSGLMAHAAQVFSAYRRNDPVNAVSGTLAPSVGDGGSNPDGQPPEKRTTPQAAKPQETTAPPVLLRKSGTDILV